jgi:TolB-like protein/Tfp pilus assembly protein PilF
MASLIEGYKYDIFISYRQKDNKHDGWVTEFVNNLKGELESTFKEDASVYFDINPHDGLLETHDVDESLKDKLKCLVFIPIISRTYCDPKSFAWEHEFKAFIEQASKDNYGLKVKLPGGNVANRLLPVQIHDLDAEDKKLVEDELGGHLRGIEFIYKEPGVNRPLTPNDSEDKNINKTNYRNQINKVANGVREIITGLKNQDNERKVTSTRIDEVTLSGRKNHKTKIIAGLFIVLVLIILGFLFVPRLLKPSEELEKSIAVLPFINDSPDTSTTYFINGLMDEIIIKLQTIRVLRVLGRTSVEQYRNISNKSSSEIARELGVNYIIEGSGQKYNNAFRLRVQLVRAKGKESHLWANSYEQEIRNPKDIFSIQSNIAQSIATELKAVITPEERELIEKIPTTNLTAYDFYQRGQEEQSKYNQYNPSTRVALDQAGKLYKKALEYDPEFAQAFIGMADVYFSKHYYETYFSENYLDSVLILSNKALSIDNQLSEAYTIKGIYYNYKGLTRQAIEELDKALRYNLNDYRAYLVKASSFYRLGELSQSIKNIHELLRRYHGENLPNYIRSLAWYYTNIGFSEKGKYYYQEALTLDGDSSKYLLGLGWIEFNLENFEEGLKLAKREMEIDTSLHYIDPACYYYVPSKYDYEAYLNAKNFVESQEKAGSLVGLKGYYYRIGYAFWKVGKKEKAEYYFNQQIKIDEAGLKLGRITSEWAYYQLAASYAFFGKKESAYKYLEEFDKENSSFPLWWVVMIKHDPYFDSFRNEDRFQKIQKSIEAKYQAEHERVREWLEENK